MGLTFSTYALPKLCGEFDFVLVCLLEVDVDVEASADTIRDWRCEGAVRVALLRGWRIDVGLAVFGLSTGPWVRTCYPRNRRTLASQRMRGFSNADLRWQLRELAVAFERGRIRV